MQTMNVLRRLDAKRISEVLDFLRYTDFLDREREVRLVDLSGTTFRLIDLRGVDLSELDLSDTDLSAADLRNANLFGAKLEYSNLNGTYLQGANLGFADLTNANLDTEHFSETTILPNGDNWKSGIDMTCFVDPTHPKYWKPTPVESNQAPTLAP
jgi:uncharacterized protein YjbI with pentapeptide repeats